MTTVNDNDMVSAGDGTMTTVFSPVPEGDQVMEFTGEINRWQSNPDGYSIGLEYVDDPTAKAAILCDLSRQDGLVKMLDAIRLSGVIDKLVKKGKLDASAKQSIKAGTLRSEKFHEQLKVDLAGCRILATIKHSKRTYTDKEGNEREGINSNVTKIQSLNGGPASQASTANKATDEEDAW